jgi:2-oxoisovalerate dehydrogenase E1 component
VPLLFVVENNGIAQTTRTADTIGGSIVARGAAFGLATWTVDDSAADFFQQVEAVVEHVRSTRQPGFLVIDTMRLGPHSKGDDLREADEMSFIRSRDPLERLGGRLRPEARATIERDNSAYLDDVRRLCEGAEESRFTQTPLHVFAGRLEGRRAVGPATRTLATPQTVRSSLNAALHRMLASHPEVIVLGEDLHDPYGGAFKVTSGLSTAFPRRVISTPISEAGVVGSAIGLSLAGFRPIVEIMFADFVTLAMDQLYNHAVKLPGLSEHSRVPIVVRTPAGGRRGYGPTHSQSPEGLMTAVPGLTVVFPSHRHDAGALLENATMRWDHPVIFFEHKLLYALTQEPGDYRVADSAASDPGAALFPTVVSGVDDPDLTIVTYGGMLPIVEKVVSALADEELSVSVVVPSLLQPLAKATLLPLLLAKRCIAIVEETPAGPGFGSELMAALLEHGYPGRVRRFAPPPVPIPAARSLETAVLPDERSLFGDVVSFVSSTDR